MVYAVVKYGGKQVRAEKGQTVRIEKIAGTKGSTVEFKDVLLVSDGATVKVGRPNVPGAKVTCEIASHGRGKKLTVFRDMMRKGIRKRTGHRQSYTEIKVTEIVAG